MSSLRAMLERRAVSDKGERLFRLARLEFELAVLREAAQLGSGDWEAPALSCRRLLAEVPSFNRRHEVWLFLAGLELRRGRHQAALQVLEQLESRRPPAQVRCRGRMLAGEAWSAERQHSTNAVEAYTQALEVCGGEEKQQARYRLAWALLADRRPAQAAAELRRLLSESLPGWLRERALGDLVLTWSHGSPPDDAATFLLARGGPVLGKRLILELGERLLEEQRLAPVLRLSTGRPAQLSAETGSQLRKLRLRALARLGTPQALEQEVSSQRQHNPPGLAAVVSASRLELAERLSRSSDIAQLSQAELLYKKIAEEGAGPDRQHAALRLGELRRRSGDLEGAVSALEVALRLEGARRATASYQLLQLLEELLASAPDTRKAALRARLCSAAWQHASSFPAGTETAEVLLLLASEELARRDFASAGRAAEQFLSRFPRHSRFEEGSRLMLEALQGTQSWERAYQLAAARSGKSWREAAARAALLRCRELAGRGDWDGAGQWVQKAQQVAGELPLGDEVPMAAALVALRQQRFSEAEKIYRSLAEKAGAQRAGAALHLSELMEARGDFAGAAQVYARAALEAATPAKRLELRRRRAAAHLAGDDQKGGYAAALALLHAVENEVLPAAEHLHWQLRAANLLLRSGSAGQRTVLALASRLEQDQPRAAAHLLLRVARASNAPRPLLERALKLSAARQRRGEMASEVAEAQLRLARLDRQRAARLEAGTAGSLLLLQQQLPPLLGVLSKAEPRWAAEAGLELAQIYQQLAATLRAARAPRSLAAGERAPYRAALEQRATELERQRGQLLSRLAAAGTWPAARLIAAPAARQLRPEHLPSTSPAVEPALALLRAGRPRAARLAASRMLGLIGERQDLLCARAVGALAEDGVVAADRDLQAALDANPGSRCARLNLAVLALWRGDASRARELLDGVPTMGLALGALLKDASLAAEEPGLEAALAH